jgi:hypothetical protein
MINLGDVSGTKVKEFKNANEYVVKGPKGMHEKKS